MGEGLRSTKAGPLLPQLAQLWRVLPAPMPHRVSSWASLSAPASVTPHPQELLPGDAAITPLFEDRSPRMSFHRDCQEQISNALVNLFWGLVTLLIGGVCDVIVKGSFSVKGVMDWI